VCAFHHFGGLKTTRSPSRWGKNFEIFFKKNFWGTRNFSKSPGNFFREKKFFEKNFFAQKHFLWCFEPKKILKKIFLPWAKIFRDLENFSKKFFQKFFFRPKTLFMGF